MSKVHEPLSVVVAGGGTAGHIEPAMAVAEVLRDDHGVRVTAMGTKKGLDKDIVPERGFDLRMIRPVPVPRKVNATLAALPLNVVKAVRETQKILADVEADCRSGFGGYWAAPAYSAARRPGIPSFVHEANARAGMANKLGIALGGIGLTAVAGSGVKGDVVGVPIARRLYPGNEETQSKRRAEAYAQWGLEDGKKTLLVTGGSQGALSLNRALAGALDSITAAGFQVLHAYGPKNEPPGSHGNYAAVPYIKDMSLAYAIADVVVCRAGAMTVAEVTAAGIPAIYVPLPHGNGEQALNAQPVVKTGGATIINDAQLTAETLSSQVLAILNDSEILESMAESTRRSTLGHASEDIAERVFAKARSFRKGK